MTRRPYKNYLSISQANQSKNIVVQEIRIVMTVTEYNRIVHVIICCRKIAISN